MEANRHALSEQIFQRIGVVPVLLALATSFAIAQGKPALRVVIEGVGKEAAACGIGEAALQAAAARGLKSHGIAPSSDAADPYLYVNVNAYRVMQGPAVVGCTTRLGVSVRGVVDPRSRAGSFASKSGAYLVLCEAGRLLSGAQRDVAGAVRKALEEDIKACLGQLNY